MTEPDEDSSPEPAPGGNETGSLAPSTPTTVSDTSPGDGGPSPALGSSELLSPGTVMGRFIVHRLLGMGGAGVVYAAHDPELDRTIALKILRRELAELADSRARFLREAQALARLSHPNVIAVYDVGAADGRTFIAMEYIAGQTFGDWVSTATPRWPELVAVLIKAGRGLAAAHAADLIHRDFKPGNLLVGADGRVVVTDFGLARVVAAGTPEPPEENAAISSRARELDRSVTRTGAVQGTPAYMSPEQQAGEPADARADQFSFCLTLYEALFREHPSAWQGQDRAPRAPRDSRGVPQWLQRAVLRGLSWEPADRHRDMPSLLAALGREPLWRRRSARIGLAAALIVAGGLAFGWGALRESPIETCTSGGEQIARVWNPAMESRLRASFAATGRPHALTSVDRIGERLGGYLGGWAGMHRDTCLATARGEQSPELLDRRMACLDRRLSRVRDLLDLFTGRADGDLVDRAIAMVGDLEPLPTCADSAALLSRAAPPADPGRRARVAELEHRVDRAELERLAGRAASSADAARAAVAEAEPLDYAPLSAQAGRVLGRALEDLGRPVEAREALFRAQRAAERAGDARLATQLLIDLVRVVGVRQEQYGEARVLQTLTEAALERPELHGDDALRALLLEGLGRMATQERRIDRAIELQREALAIRRRVFPAFSDEVASAEENLAIALNDKGLQPEAREHYDQALSIRLRLFGDQHPLTASVRINLATTFLDEARAAEARPLLLAALAVLERMPEYRTYPIILNNLAALESSVGNYQQARKYSDANVAERRARLGPDHPALALALDQSGSILRELGDPTGALERHRMAYAIHERNKTTDHPRCGDILADMAEDLRHLGRPAEALQHAERAVAIIEARAPDRLSNALLYRGLALRDLGRTREAIPSLERATKNLTRPGINWARAALALAQALEPGRPVSTRLRELAEQARDAFAATNRTAERDEAIAYLAGSGRRADLRRKRR